MKLFKDIFGKKADETPVWDITPEALRPAPRKRTPVDEPTMPMPQKDDSPFMDASLDTIQLETEDLVVDNPYQTHSWELDPENETRRLKQIQIGEATEKNLESSFNPYDTGSLRRGRKK